MPSLALSIFLLVLITQIIQWVGQSVLEDYAFALYTRLFSPGPARKQRQLRKEVYSDKQDLMRTSAQDEFAKWAKLRRKVDKGLADLEKLNSEMSTARTAFSVKFRTVLWLLTTGTQWAIAWWYRSVPVFWLPPGWLGPIGYWLSFPWAPRGSVSCGVWQFACRRAIKQFERLVLAIFSMLTNRTAGMAMPNPTPVPMAVPAGAPGGGREKKTQ